MEFMKWRRAISFLLCVAMLLGNFPVLTFAADTNGLCEHHTEHSDCSYVEGASACDLVCELCAAEDETEPEVTEEPTEPKETEASTEPRTTEPVCMGLTDCAAQTHDAACEKAAQEKLATDMAAAAEVKALIDALPSLEEVQAKPLADALPEYNQVNAAYDAYNALTDDQKDLVGCGMEFFEPYMLYFSGQTQLATVYSGKFGTDGRWTLDTSTGALQVWGSGRLNSSGWSQYSNSVKSVVINNGITAIPAESFLNYSNLISVKLPATVTEIGAYAFAYSWDLASLNIPSSVTHIGRVAFADTKIGNVTLPAGLTTLGDSAFAGVDGLTSITIPSGITTIDYHMFCGCTELKTVVLHDKVAEIGESAFALTAISSITIPASVKTIVTEAFAACYNLKEIHFKGSAPSFVKGDYTSTMWHFDDVVATAYYPCNDSSWTPSIRQNYGGQITWVATCGNHNFTNPVIRYTWSDDLTTCTAAKYCSNSGCQVAMSGSEKRVTATATVAEAATCTEDGKMLYTATFSSPYETQTNEGIINETGHIYDRQVAEEKYLSAPANCQSAATYVMSCVCGEAGTETFTAGELDSANHNFVNDHCACGAVRISENTFPDANFRAFITSQDYGADGILTSEELSSVTSMDMSTREIEDLTGIEYFTALTRLECYECRLTSLDVSKNTALTYLYCADNQLTALDVSQNTELKYLNCDRNQLTELDVSNNTALGYLNCSGNQLTSLDVSKNTELQSLDCSGNMLTSLDVSENSIRTLDCSNNRRGAMVFNNQFDLNLLTPEGFDINKVKSWQGGTVRGNILTVTEEIVSYTYDIGRDAPQKFELVIFGFHTHNFTEQVDDRYLVTPETCSDRTVYYKSCECGEASTETFTADTPVHVGGTELKDQKDATCTADGYTGDIHCLGCDSMIQTGETVTAPGHAFSGGICANCGAGGGYCGNSAVNGGKNVTWRIEENVLYIEGNGAMAGYTSSTKQPWASQADNIHTVRISEGITEIGSYTFCEMQSLTAAYLPEGLLSIGEAAFAGCEKLNCAPLPESLEVIGEVAFAATGFAHVQIPAGVTSVHKYAFDINSLKDVFFTGTQEQWDAFGVQLRNPVYVHIGSAYSADHWREVSEEPSCTRSGYTARECDCGHFAVGAYIAPRHTFGDDNICTVCGSKPPVDEGTCGPNVIWRLDEDGTLTVAGVGKMHDNVSELVKHQFDIKKVIVCDGVTSVGSNAFGFFTNMKEVWLGDDVAQIGRYSFSGCRGLVSIRIPASVETMYEPLFTYAYSLEDIYFGGSQEVWDSWNTGEFDTTRLHANCSDPSTHWIGDGKEASCTESVVSTSTCSCGYSVETVLTALGHDISHWETTQKPTCTEDGIKTGICSRCGELPETLPATGHDFVDNVCTACGHIGGKCGDNAQWAYDAENCILTISGTDAMYDYTGTDVPWSSYLDKIARVEIESGITRIGNYAFWNCGAMEEVVIPDSIAGIGTEAFGNCDLTDVYFGGTSAAWENLGMNRPTGENLRVHYECTDAENHWAETTVNPTCGEAGYSCLMCACDPAYIIDRETIPSMPATGKHIYSEQVVDEAYLALNANCRFAAEYYFSCVCGAKGEDTFTYGEPGDHIRDEYHECTVCDHIGGKCGRNAEWTYDAETFVLTIFGTDEMYDYYNNEAPWISYCEEIARVEVENGITRIGHNAFENCVALREVSIADSVTAIGSSAFRGCISLLEIDIPDGVTQIASSVFYGCESLTKIDLPASATTIEPYAFAQCIALTELTIPAGVTRLGYSIFYGCSSLERVVLPEGITEISNSTFYNCSSLKELDIPDDVTKIGYMAFDGCSSLTQLEIPNGVTEIGFSAFGDCAGLTKLIIPDGVTLIDNGTFSGCTNLTEITIPAGITSVGDYAFSRCKGLADVYYGGTSEQWTALGSNCPSGTNLRIHYECTDPATHWMEDIKSPTCAESGYSREVCCCEAAYVRNEVIAPPTEAHVFDQNRAVDAYLVTPATCTEQAVYYKSCICGKAGEETFMAGELERHEWDDATCKDPKTCSRCGETEGEIDPNGHIRDNKNTCTRCGQVGGICGSDCVHFAGNCGPECGHIGDCCEQHNYIRWTLDEANGVLTMYGRGWMYDYNMHAPWHLNWKRPISVIIEPGTLAIGSFAFSDLSGAITSVQIPNTVTEIREAAFHIAHILSPVTIPDSVERVGAWAFATIWDMKEVTVEGGTTFGEYAFAWCQDLETVTLGAGVTGSVSMFEECPSLKNVSLPEDLTIIDDRFFAMCTSLEYITIPDSVATIGTDAFRGCIKLDNLVIPEGVETIESGAFAQCSNLTTMVIPVSVTSIGSEAFVNCDNLTDVYYAGDANAWAALSNRPSSENLRVHYECAGPDGHWTTKTMQATCAEDGYTCEVCSCVAAYERNKVVEPATENHIFNKETVSDAYLVTPATCTEQAVYCKSCVCGKAGEETFESGALADHVYDKEKVSDEYLVTPATCTEQALYYKSCVCGKAGEETFKSGALADHVYDKETVSDEYLLTPATCTEQAVYCKSCVCGKAGEETFRNGALAEHQYAAVVTDPTCQEKGYTTHTCSACGDKYVDSYVDKVEHVWTAATCNNPKTCTLCGTTEGTATNKHNYESVAVEATCEEKGYIDYTCTVCGYNTQDNFVSARGHIMSGWILFTEATAEVDGEERNSCLRDECDYYESRKVEYRGNLLKLEDKELKAQSVVYVNGLPYPVINKPGGYYYVELPTEEDCYMVTYTYHVGDAKDVHTQYPTGMKVYKVSNGKATYIPELDNLLQYSGSSIRITGKKGIRMITSLNKNTKAALTGKGLAGFKLLEYGTVLSFASEMAGDGDLVLGKSYSRSNYAYKKGVADPVFATSGNLTQYTNVLVGFSLDQCKDDIAMRPYIILEDANGQQVTLYGGTIYRSIGYIAYQNRNVFKPGNASYDYVWEIIHHVYGNKYDKDYKG